MNSKKRVVFAVIVLTAMVMAMCFGNTLWGKASQHATGESLARAPESVHAEGADAHGL